MTEKPAWWVENEKIRHEMGLPIYDPPRFNDGIYTHKIIPKIESAHDCRIQFISHIETEERKWNIRINGEDACQVRKRRTENGNTIYEMDSESFEDLILTFLEEVD